MGPALRARANENSLNGFLRLPREFCQTTPDAETAMRKEVYGRGGAGERTQIALRVRQSAERRTKASVWMKVVAESAVATGKRHGIIG